MDRKISARAALVAALIVTGLPVHARAQAKGCDADNAGLTVPSGFCVGVFARNVPAPRHMVVTPNGDVFVISSRGGRGGGPPRGIFRLRDANADGKADTVEKVADATGSGIWLGNNALYAEMAAMPPGGTGPSQTAMIVRYPFKSGSSDLTGAVDTIVTGLPLAQGHSTREMVVRGNELFVNVGSATNICEAPMPRGIDPKTNQPYQRPPNGQMPSPDPCTELETRAGIWKFDANQKGQTFTPGARYATGVRNAVGLTLNPRDNQVYTTQHGRDQLRFWHKETDSLQYNAENPGEEFFRIVQGGDYGWPYCYYSHAEKKKVDAPEYGGDGKKTDRCARVQQPVYAFPGHWAPNAAHFYTGTMFPQKYRDGVFVAFHGSWNRAPLPQAGFNVSYLPMKDGRATGAHEVFADGFFGSRAKDSPQGGEHRPTGLAQLRDGSLLVSDDAGGIIYRIAYAR